VFKAVVKFNDKKIPDVKFTSESRKAMHGLKQLCNENGYACEVTVDVVPRVVKFKNL
jgi:hypothetical protein